MKLHALTALLLSASLASVSFTASAAPKQPRGISKAKAVSIAKARVGGGRVTDIGRSEGRYEIEIRKGCTEYDVDVSIRTGRVVDIDTDNRCDND
ncbi:PepSY domain-containing protein [Neisseria sp.]|uniref:PepSY domain-containing protein n=1 Tax=Neisseria sp. TaxID=192066 RepID=UPI0035A0C71A